MLFVEQYRSTNSYIIHRYPERARETILYIVCGVHARSMDIIVSSTIYMCITHARCVFNTYYLKCQCLIEPCSQQAMINHSCFIAYGVCKTQTRCADCIIAEAFACRFGVWEQHIVVPTASSVCTSIFSRHTWTYTYCVQYMDSFFIVLCCSITYTNVVSIKSVVNML